jgi:uncharacterized repeat protein (TIGR03803 family)
MPSIGHPQIARIYLDSHIPPEYSSCPARKVKIVEATPPPSLRATATRSRKRGTVNKFSLLKTASFVFVFCIAATIASYGQATFTSLVSFDGTNGANPYSSLIRGTDGNFYGTTRFDGSPEANCSGGCGTAFKLTPEGALTVLYNFCSQAACADGAYPGGLVQSSNGNIYGITGSGGTGKYCTARSSSTEGCGTVFSITPVGELTTLYSFCSQANCSDVCRGVYSRSDSSHERELL